MGEADQADGFVAGASRALGEADLATAVEIQSGRARSRAPHQRKGFLPQGHDCKTEVPIDDDNDDDLDDDSNDDYDNDDLDDDDDYDDDDDDDSDDDDG
eukprot:661490-Pyramimonas_sp.AAC.1